MKAIIVGHGPSMLAEPMGEEIDSHDIVIRMKRCQELLKQPEYFGTKTDVVCGSFTIATQLKKIPAEEYWVFMDSRHGDKSPEAMIEHFSPKKCIIDKDLCDSWNENYRAWRDQAGPIETPDQVKEFTPLGHNHMSAGLHTLIYACDFLDVDVVHLIGCDNLATGKWAWSLTRGPEYTNYPDHRWDVEHKIVPMVAEAYNQKIGYILPEAKCA